MNGIDKQILVAFDNNSYANTSRFYIFFKIIVLLSVWLWIVVLDFIKPSSLLAIVWLKGIYLCIHCQEL